MPTGGDWGADLQVGAAPAAPATSSQVPAGTGITDDWTGGTSTTTTTKDWAADGEWTATAEPQVREYYQF